ncbi:hypothetical protein SAMN05428970_3317 [Agromyces sp. CF514]|uniref:DUF5719 family protein n=1 Tax=Agromyces sp. CF514 TaxID=1881031 RepID=UPI0008F0E685|nr:DUF5719 family protein [Agromyces sp. CF514]SFR86543.1 hypothetical protein SAMN05428970_3317 [Agromyces sp. CF514]
MPVDRRNLVRAGVRSIAAVATAAVAVGLVGAATLGTWPSYRVEAPSTVVQPQAVSQQRVCPGPILALGADAAEATAIDQVGTASVVTATEPDDVDLGLSWLALADDPEAAEDSGPLVIDAAAGAVDAGMLAGAQSQTESSETIGGFVAASCTEGIAESWLVAGATTVGRSSLVLLSNASDVAATVDVRVIGEAGPVEARSAIGITVPARTQRVLSLAGLAPNIASPVVHVTSTGGAIAASLEQSVVEGLTPAGVEISGPTAPPAESQVIPGLLIAGGTGVHADEDHAEGDAFPALRLYSPSGEQVEASISVVPIGGGAGDSIDVDLQAGKVSDIPLGELAEGTYTVRVDADGPIVAAARSTVAAPADDDAGTDAEVPADLAWFAAAQPLLDSAVIAVPSGPSPTLQLAAGTDAVDAASVTVTVDGDEVEVPPSGAVSVPLQRGTAVLGGVEGLRASVKFLGADALASFAVAPPGPLDSPIRVYPR